MTFRKKLVTLSINIAKAGDPMRFTQLYLQMCVGIASALLVTQLVPAQISASSSAQTLPVSQVQVPKDILKHLETSELKKQARTCENNPGEKKGLPPSSVSAACLSVARDMATELSVFKSIAGGEIGGGASTYGWLGEPGMFNRVRDTGQALARRACALGSADGCLLLGDWLLAAGDPTAIDVLKSQACEADDHCKEMRINDETNNVKNGQVSPHVRDLNETMYPTIAPGNAAEIAATGRAESSSTGLFSTIVNAAAPLTSNADPNGIQNAANQQTANIQAKQSQAQAAQAADAQRRQATAQQAQQVARAQSSVPISSGTAAPPIAIPRPPATATNINPVCPASGFIPGVMTHPSPDVALGVQCKPGSVIYINGVPQFDTTRTGLGAVTRSGAGGGTNGSGNGGGLVNSTDGPPEAGCIQLSSDPTNTYPVFHNTCSFAVKYFWTPFTIPPGGYAEQNGILQPGETQRGEETAVGGYRVYACQTNYSVVGPDGTPITGVVNGYRCVKQ